MRPFRKDLLAILLITISLLFFFREQIQYNITYYESDTPAYYYPVMSDLAQAYREGTLRLWSPDLFGGFPLFADGESGALYPIHLLLLPFFTIEQTWVWLILIRYLLGALFMYIFGRVLGLGQTSSVVAATVFSFGGFAIAQLHHLNVSNSAIWLPLTLAFIELAIRSRRWTRILWLLAAGVSSAIQALGVHIQVVLMSALFLSLYVPFRVIVCPALPFRKNAGADAEVAPITADVLAEAGKDLAQETTAAAGQPRTGFVAPFQPFLRRVPRRIVLASFILGLPGVIGLALASVQLLPEYALGTFSARAGGVPYSYASQYSLSGYDFLTLVFPYFFRDGGRFWGQWSLWESAVYVGILPLILFAIAVLCVRSRYTLFLGVLGLLGLWAALGGNANPDLHRLLYELPGFNQMRAPARFSYITLLCAAILSAHALEWLGRELRSSAKPVSLSKSRKVSRVTFSTITFMIVPLAIGIPICLQAASSWLTGNQALVLTTIRSNLQNLPSQNRDRAANDLFNRILHGISFENPDVQLAIGLIAGSVILLLLWNRLRNFAWLWKGLIAILIAFDLMSYAAVFHPKMTMQQLSSEPKSIAFLEQNRGMYRSFSWPASAVQPNRLFRFDVPDARGYSSLEFQRNKEYSAVVETVENRLLDIWNVRYIPRNKEAGAESFLYFNDTQFQIGRLLMSGSSKNASSSAAYTIPDVTTTDVRLIGWLRDCVDVPQGTVVGHIILTDSSGSTVKLPIKAGVDISEATIDRPDIMSRAKHAKATVAFSMTDRRPDGTTSPEHLYYANLPIPEDQSLTVKKAQIDYTYPTGRLQVFGLSLYDSAAEQPFALRTFMKDKYKVVFQGDDTIIYENLSYLPRSYLVPTAVPVESNFGILTRMTDGDWDPLKKVLIEAPKDMPLPAAQPVPSAGVGTTTITDYKDRKVKISANANIDSYLFLADSYYPGWKAFLDGQEVPIFHANYLFRAIFLPKGIHQVVFSYEPEWFRAGATISLTTIFLLCSLPVLWVVRRVLRGRLVTKRPQEAQTGHPPLTHGEPA